MLADRELKVFTPALGNMSIRFPLLLFRNIPWYLHLFPEEWRDRTDADHESWGIEPLCDAAILEYMPSGH